MISAEMSLGWVSVNGWPASHAMFQSKSRTRGNVISCGTHPIDGLADPLCLTRNGRRYSQRAEGSPSAVGPCSTTWTSVDIGTSTSMALAGKLDRLLSRPSCGPLGYMGAMGYEAATGGGSKGSAGPLEATMGPPISRGGSRIENVPSSLSWNRTCLCAR